MEPLEPSLDPPLSCHIMIYQQFVFVQAVFVHAYNFILMQLASSYWCKAMVNGVADFCKKCDICLRVNSGLGKAKAELHPIPITDVWKQIGIDIIGRQ